MSNDVKGANTSQKNILKFIIASLVGVFLFLIPIPNGSTFTIPLGIVINFVSDLLVVGDFNIANLLVLIFITLSTLLSVVGYIFKPAFIMKSETLKKYALVEPLYFVSKIIGCLVIVMVYFKVGPEFIRSIDTGGAMIDVAATLVSVVLVIAFAMPLLTDFGIMEFVGVLIRNFVRFLFTCPGRSSIDLMTSWFGASNAAAILTRNQYETGYYTGREAAVISTNFSIVSIPFCFVIAKMIGVDSHFTIWYVIICITGFLVAVITPRIWPLNKIPDTFDEISGKKIDEDVPKGVSRFDWAVKAASKRAADSSASTVAKTGLNLYLNLFIDLIPLVMSWGTIALIVVTYTPILTYISMPMGWFLQLFGIENAMAVAPITLIGFADMYIPALMLKTVESFNTRFILGALSLLQIVYMTEVGIIILKSRIPVKFWHLLVIFLERTLLCIPILLLLTKLLVR